MPATPGDEQSVMANQKRGQNGVSKALKVAHPAPVSSIAIKPAAPPPLPAGDLRLTVNLRGDVHRALKVRAAQDRTTVGEMIEAWVDSWD
jgi:hypothetical protein